MNFKFKIQQRDLSGTILPIAITFIAALIPLSALSVDLGYFGLLRSSMEKATEAAAVSGSQEYFRSKADAGKAINATVRAFKMNITDDAMIGNFYHATGKGQPSTLTYTKTFTQEDGISTFYRDASITLKVTTDLDRGKVSVTSTLTPKPFFATFLSDTAKISITKEAELPPIDVVFVIDLSGSMRFATFSTYIGSAYRQMVGMGGMGTLYNDIVLYQAQSELFGTNSVITANGYKTTINSITDVIINTPNYDIPNNAIYTTGMTVYINDLDRGYIVNSDMAIGLYRNDLSGYRISELTGLGISNEDKTLAQSYSDNRSSNSTVITDYFNMLSPYIEPIASASYGVMAFIDTVKIYGTAALKVGLVTFSSDSDKNDKTYTINLSEFKDNGQTKRLKTTFPYTSLVNPTSFDTITQDITIMSTGGNGSNNSPITTYSYPDGGTNINAGLENAKWTLDKSERSNSEKIIILFTDGEPTYHSFNALGSEVKSLTDSGITVYSVVLTLAISQNIIDQFKYQVETIGKAEPVIFINDPAKLKDAFMNIADELGLKLIN